MPRNYYKGRKPDIVEAINLVKAWQADYQNSLNKEGLPPLAYKIRYDWRPNQNAKWQQISEEQANGLIPDWPMPGQYEISVLFSDETEACDPWEAERIDTKNLASVPDENPIQALFSHAQLQLRQYQIECDRLRKERNEARSQLDIERIKVQEITTEKYSLTYARDVAKAEKELAEKKQADAEAALEELQEEVNAFTPHIEVAVDRFFDNLSRQFGLNAALAQEHMDLGKEEGAGEGDPPPPGAEGLNDATKVLDDIWNAVIYDLRVCRDLCEAGVFDWATIRRAVWWRTRKDPGPEPKWEEWIAAEDKAKEAEKSEKEGS